MSEKTLLLILNPAAGTRQARKVLPELIQLFMSYGWQNLVCVTAARGDATRFVEQMGHRAQLIVCIGGDGTFNETVTGLMHTGLDLPIGYIPAGSTNDFANSLKLSSDILQAGRNIMEGQETVLDIGRFNNRYFSYVASFGAFTRASYATPQSTKNALGHLAYILEGMKDLPTIRPVQLRLTANGKTYEGEYVFGAVSNSTSIGGILTLPKHEVDLQDGLMEVMLVRMPKSATELQVLLTAAATQQYACECIDFFRAERMEVLPQADLAWSLDGEFEAGSERVCIENVHRAIRVIVSPDVTEIPEDESV